MAQQSKALRCGVTTDLGSIPGCVATRKLMGQRTISPATSDLGEGLAGRDVLVPSRSSDSLWRAGRMHTDFGLQLCGVSSDTLVRLASGLSEQCVKRAMCREAV